MNTEECEGGCAAGTGQIREFLRWYVSANPVARMDLTVLPAKLWAG